MRVLFAALIALTLVAGCRTADRAAERVELAGFGYDLDDAWRRQEPSSTMRAAQYVLAGRGYEDDATLVVYFFGDRGAGGIQANLDRWIDQFERPEGSPDPLVEQREIGGLRVDTVDVSGRYVAEMTPGSGERHDNPDWRLLAAVVSTDVGPYYVKLVGPARTVERWRASYLAFLESVRANDVAAGSAAEHP